MSDDTTPDAQTAQYALNHLMVRVRDPEASLDFYTRVLGMTLLSRLDMEQSSFSNYYLGYRDVQGDDPRSRDRLGATFRGQGVLELTHNWGTEEDESFEGYHHGNSEPKGYGHICLRVPDLEAACARFDRLGVTFSKRPDEGGMKGLAFIKDPDGYMIEVIDEATLDHLVGHG